MTRNILSSGRLAGAGTKRNSPRALIHVERHFLLPRKDYGWKLEGWPQFQSQSIQFRCASWSASSFKGVISAENAISLAPTAPWKELAGTNGFSARVRPAIRRRFRLVTMWKRAI